MSGVFVTGTDTGVGKTLVSAILVRALRAAYFKPLQTGLADEPGDAATVARLTPLEAEFVLPSVYAFQASLSPEAAGAAEGVVIDPGRLVVPARERPVVVEGAGGVLVPVAPGVLMADVMRRFGMPVLVVARSGLGTINHTLLTIEAMRGRGLLVAGVVMSGTPHAGNRAAIERIGGVAVVAELPVLPAVDARVVAAIAADWQGWIEQQAAGGGAGWAWAHSVGSGPGSAGDV